MENVIFWVKLNVVNPDFFTSDKRYPVFKIEDSISENTYFLTFDDKNNFTWLAMQNCKFAI